MDDEVQGTEETVSEVTPDYDSLSSSFEESNDTANESDSPVAEGSRNPAWSPILDLIPEQLHNQVIPHLSKTDKHVQQLQQTYAPFKRYVDQGISPDLIENSLTLADAIRNDPQSVYDQMREQFGLSHEEAIDAIEDNSEYGDEEDGEDVSQGYGGYEDDEDGEDNDLSNHPAFQQLQNQYNELAEDRANHQREQMMANIQEEVNREWAEIEAKVGGRLPQNVRDDIQQRALNLAGENGMPKLADGFREHVKFVSSIRNSTANNFAPSVSDGTGLLPSNPKYDMSTSQGRQDRIADFARVHMNRG